MTEGCAGAAVAGEARRGRTGRSCPATSSSESLGPVTEDLNRRWYELNSGQVIIDVQRRVRHPAVRWMAATLDGRVESQRGGALRSKFYAAMVILGGSGRRGSYMPQLQHNMWVVSKPKSAVLSW